MNAIYILIPIGLLFLVVAIGALAWALNSGQYDDLDSPGVRILSDDEEHTENAASVEAASRRDSS